MASSRKKPQNAHINLSRIGIKYPTQLISLGYCIVHYDGAESLDARSPINL